MPLPDAAVAHYARQKAVTAGIVHRARAVWSSIDPAALDRSWTSGRAGERMFVTVSAGQQVAAGLADPYLDAVLAEQGIDAVRSASVIPKSFAGVASDGRNLESLLYEPVIAVKAALSAGAALAEAMAAGEASTIRIVGTQVTDAGRTAVGAGMVARPSVTSWTRMLNPPSCSRCAVLAGRVYRYNAGFHRHPACDCQAVPSSEDVAGDLTTDPKSYFDGLSATDQAKYFTEAGAQAIRGGADIGQVVNARSGMYQANGQTFTTTGTTSRGVAGKRLQGAPRQMPETLIAQANGDRAAMVDALVRHGYIA